ncbi:SdrD B-like domain-containing protein [Actinokineospora bangkokensis]|uniref:SD-repeat containing protein B domain-containing protein n=1 Tax=Actinokineospora bangkokensis TaxID=1193682 RepID=A0A1Q9LNF2_9PSEU|nr:SdrD B-like domain-containing protein [Actinokineospora bangkokensis]OLR93545.1 hypothetical protein BJP25_14710 [Actinokineospora bangkokensis]
MNRTATTATVAAALALGALLTPGSAAADPATTGSITGLSFFDRDADGIFGAGDRPMGGSPSYVVTDLATGEVTYKLWSNQDGTYSVDDLAPGDYEILGRTGWYAKTTPETVRVRVEAGQAVVVDFGARGARVGGSAWIDTDGDGVREAGEPAAAHAPLYVNTPYLAYATTDAQGNYQVEDLPVVGSGKVQPQALEGYTFTTPGGDSDIDPATGSSATFPMTADTDEVVTIGYAPVG